MFGNAAQQRLSYYLDGTRQPNTRRSPCTPQRFRSFSSILTRPLAQRVFSEHILRRYVADPASAHWGNGDESFKQNWAWFATALDGWRDDESLGRAADNAFGGSSPLAVR